MEAIYIPQLAKISPDRTEAFQLDEFLPGLETLTPVRGTLRVTHQGNYLEVKAKAETIMTLSCDRCLKQYNHRIKINTSEFIWLDGVPNELDLETLEHTSEVEELIETLPSNGFFDPAEWLYEQLCLEIPPLHLCDPLWQGISLNQETDQATNSDQRWAALEALKQALKE